MAQGLPEGCLFCPLVEQVVRVSCVQCDRSVSSASRRALKVLGVLKVHRR